MTDHSGDIVIFPLALTLVIDSACRDIDPHMLDVLPDDHVELARLLRSARYLKRLAGDIERRAEAALAEAMPSKVVAIEGFGTLERKKGSARRAWDNEGLFGRLAAMAMKPENLMDPMTGEIVRTPLEAFKTFVRDCCAPSYWRKKELGGLGIDINDFCEVLEPKVSVIIR